MSIDEIVAQARDIFVLPDSVARLKECMDDDAASIDDVSEIIGFDPGLVTQILKVANSALYRFPNKISTISKALQVIGTRAAYDLALAYGIANAFSDIESKYMDLDKFWEQSVSCGLLAKYLADSRGARDSESLFVSGLLHNIGELVMVSIHPEQVKRCQAFNSRVSPAELQIAVHGFTYTDLTAKLMESWDFPQKLSLPIAHIHDVKTSNDFAFQILQLAYVLALDNVNPEIYPSYNNLKPEMHECLGLEHDDLEDALDVTNLQCISIISLFNPSAFILY
jgi:HD-like signal output (HDOD) protein